MYANSKQITVAGVATLLLAIATVITVVSCQCHAQNYKYLFKMDKESSQIELWGPKPECGEREEKLDHSHMYSHTVGGMLDEFKRELKKPEVIVHTDEFKVKWKKSRANQHRYIRDLVSFADTTKDCTAGTVEQFLKLTVGCDDQERYENYVYFMKENAREKFKQCSLAIINDLKRNPDQAFEQIKEFFKAGLRMNNRPVSDGEIFNHLKDLDLAYNNLDVEAMVLVGDRFYGNEFGRILHSVENLISDLGRSLYQFKCLFKVNTLRIALSIGSFEEKGLTDTTRLMDVFARFAAQLSDEGCRAQIENYFGYRFKQALKKAQS